MKILVTGDRGYIGSVLTQMLEEKSHEVVGYDIDYYQGTDLYPAKRNYKHITKDLRHISPADVDGMDAIIHLAGLSNDPLGELNPDLTLDINYKATIKLATLAKEAGVKRFIYSSLKVCTEFLIQKMNWMKMKAKRILLLPMQEPNGRQN